MIKWLAFIMALIAICYSADESKVARDFDLVKARLESLERKQCTLMVVLTPTGQTSICAQ